MRRRAMLRTGGVWAMAAATAAGMLLVLGAAQGAGAQGFAQPTEAHKALESEVGTWTAKIQAWEPGVDEPSESEGKEVNTMVGGLWLASDFRGELGTMPFHGHGITGYDPEKKKYVGVWVDSMSSEILQLEGTYDAAGKVLTLEGKSKAPGVDEPLGLKVTTTANADGTRTMRMFMKGGPIGDAETKLMEVVYTKAAAPSR